MSSKSQAGKGDRNRTSDHDKYRREYDRIFGRGKNAKQKPKPSRDV